MIEITLRLAGGNRIVKVSGDSPKDAFEQMAMAYEVFNETTCGLCGSTNIRPVHRQVEKFHFYEFGCNDCDARLSLGQLSDNSGGLFPVRRLIPATGKPDFKLGTTGRHRGWTHFKGQPAD